MVEKEKGKGWGRSESWRGGVGIFCRGKKKKESPYENEQGGGRDEGSRGGGGGGVVEDGDSWGNVWASGKPFLIFPAK